MSAQEWAAAAHQQASTGNARRIRRDDPRLQDLADSSHWTFVYDPANQHGNRWEKAMKCMRCAHVNLETNQRCKRVTCITLPVCWQHLKSDYKLRVGRTSLRDTTGARLNFLGLFACDESKGSDAVVFKRDEYIVPYVAEEIDGAELEARYPGEHTGIYVVENEADSFEDGAIVRGAAGLSNMCIGRLAYKENGRATCANNAVIAGRAGPNYFPFLQAMKPIRNGQEVFTSYGRQYFKKGGIYADYETRPGKKYVKTEHKCKR
jgi:hypothetical protein